MSRRPSARMPSRFPPGGADAKARLGLLETLFVSDDAAECARRAASWLGEHAGVTAAMVAAVNPEGTRLVAIADYGISPRNGAELFVDLEDRGHPLIGALAAKQLGATFSSGETVGGLAAAFGRRPFAAVPLRTLDVAHDRPIGLLLLESVSAAESQDVRWIAEILGQKLAQLHSSGILADSERRLRRERTLLESVINAVSDPIVVTDPSGNIVLMNAPAERLFTVGRGGSDEQAQRVRANDAHFTSHISNLFFATTGLRYSGSIALVDPETGAALPTEGLSGKILSEHGEVNAVVTILHDLTEAKEKERLYEQLKRASDELEQKVSEATAELSRQNELLRRQHFELEQASALKSQFLANMSHEFRTPLNAILGYTHTLLHGVAGKLSERQRGNLSRIDSNGRHLLAIINDILDIARIEAGKMPLTLSEVAVPEMINEVMAEMEPIIVRSRLPVAVIIDPAPPIVRTDRPKLEQIVLNLLGNALKFTPEGAVRIEARRARGGKEITIAVTDTGIGIAEVDYEKIFEDFRQADNSLTREYGGTGLGLSICRRLANMLGGRITVVSKLGQGSTFTLTLPTREPS